MPRIRRRRVARALLALAIVVACGAPGIAAPAFAVDAVCPACGAPLAHGAAFCTACGRRVEAPAPERAVPAAAPEPAASVVRLIATHDKKLTSTLGAMAFGTAIRVDFLTGSAFAVSPGEFVTDAGLLAGARAIILQTSEGDAPGRVVGVDPLIGIGLVAADLPAVPPLLLRGGAPPSPGTALTALGFAAAKPARAAISTRGVVSGVHRRDVGIHPIEDYIQIDASLPSGFAGGPVVDAAGAAAGMSTALPIGRRMELGMAGIGRAVPAPWLERGLAWIRAGRPERPWMGLLVQAADEEARRTHALPAGVPFIVEEVFAGSPAAAAGVRRGDGLAAIDGVPIASTLAVHERLLETRPGVAWSLTVRRRDGESILAVTLAPRPENLRLTGLQTLRRYGGLDIETRQDDLVAARVLAGSPASESGVRSGDQLTYILYKKDLSQVRRDDTRWRAVGSLETLEKLVVGGYSDFDLFLGLRFRARDGKKHELYISEPILPIAAF